MGDEEWGDGKWVSIFMGRGRERKVTWKGKNRKRGNYQKKEGKEK